MKNRKGVITIDKQIISNNLGDLKMVFANFIPVFIQEDFNSKTYYGYSDLFDEIDEGCEGPKYDVVLTWVSDSERKIEFKRL